MMGQYVVKSPPAAILETTQESEVPFIYPNPVQHSLQIRSKTNRWFSNVSIRDLMGRTLFFQPRVQPNASIDMRTFPSGIYLMETGDEHGNIRRWKLVKE